MFIIWTLYRLKIGRSVYDLFCNSLVINMSFVLAYHLISILCPNQSKMKNNLIIVCLLSSLSLPVCGQGTLDDCIRYAWEHNPGFKNIRIDVKEARTDYVAAMGFTSIRIFLKPGLCSQA